VAELAPFAGTVTVVPIDFEHESLDGVLDRAGHDRSMPTCWIWEGVVMYLTRDAMHETLTAVAGRSGRGSTLIVTYHIAHRRPLARMLFQLIGEPQISAWTREEMAADLKSAGFQVRADTAIAEWNERFAQGQAKVERVSCMRVVEARR
jgi:methyltransferase (TIGR00027 family)